MNIKIGTLLKKLPWFRWGKKKKNNKYTHRMHSHIFGPDDQNHLKFGR